MLIVTPLAGVWIEIDTFMELYKEVTSLPSRECGLKLSRLMQYLTQKQSLPSRECGLK